MAKYKTVFVIVLSLLIFSCQFGTGIVVTNNTKHQIIIECETMYDTRSDNIENFDGRLMRHVRVDSGGYFLIVAGPLELTKKERGHLISRVGTDIIKDLGLGTIKSLDDVVAAIDTIFIKIDVFIVKNGSKTLLYNKNYFLNKENMEIKAGNIRFTFS